MKAPVQYKRMDDTELVQRAQRELPYGMRAYEELVRRHEGTLYAVCLRLVGNRQDAEDVSQDVMLKVYAKIGRFEGRSSFKTWLLRIATNACTDRLKKRPSQTGMRSRYETNPLRIRNRCTMTVER